MDHGARRKHQSHADQNERDYRAFIRAVREGRLKAIAEA
jgi:hypothetical protein